MPTEANAEIATPARETSTDAARLVAAMLTDVPRHASAAALLEPLLAIPAFLGVSWFKDELVARTRSARHRAPHPPDAV